MKFILFLIIFFVSFYSTVVFSQEITKNNSFKISISEHGLHCPNLGPKLKVNMKQIGGEVIYFNIETSIMVVNIPAKDLEKSNTNYLETIIQLTGYPDELIKIEKLTSTQVNDFLENTPKDEK